MKTDKPAANKIVVGVARGWLSKRDARPDRPFYLSFRVGERGNYEANQISMETADARVARERARDFLTMRDRAWRESGESKWSKLRAELRMEGQRGWPSAEKIGEAYLAAAPAEKRGTMRKNQLDLRAIVEQGSGQGWEKFSALGFTRDFAFRWMRLRQEYQRLLAELEDAEELRESHGWAVALADLRKALAGRRAACKDPAIGLLRRALESAAVDPVGAGANCLAAGRSDIGAILQAAAAAQRECHRLAQEMDWSRLRARLDSLPPLDPDTRRPGNATINSMLNHAQCVLGQRAQTFRLAGLDLPPNVAEFCAIGKIAEEPAHFVPIPADAYAAMHAASAQLAIDDPEAYRVNQLIRKLGLRACEVIASRASWLEVDEHGFRHAEPGGRLIVVKDRPAEQFWVKSGAAKARFLPVDAALVQLLADRPGLLIADTPHAAEQAVRRHNAWLRAFIPDRQKAGHELRKHVGALIYSRHGATAAAEYLGHASPDVTVRHYAAYINQLPVIAEADLASAALRRLRRPSG